jgi:lysyl-tRNA synthetase class 2
MMVVMRAWSGRVLTALLCLSALALAVGSPPAWLPGGRLSPLDRIPLALVLLLLAHGLAGRRRLALQVTLALVIIALLPPVHPAQLVLPAVAGLLLLPGRYPVRPDPQRLRTAMMAAGGALAVVLGRGFWEAARHRAPVRQAAYAALPFPPGAPDRSTRVFVVVVLAAVLVALAVALAGAPAPPPAGEAERAQVRCLVQDPAAGSLAPFATRADRTYVFSPRGDAAIGYRVRFGVALAGGDPVGGDPAAAITAFEVLCAERGWRPAVLGADSVATGDLWRRAGVRRAVEIGDEAVLDVATFSLASRPMRNVRQAASRAGNAGVRVEIGPLEPALIPRLDAVLRDWLHGRAERGFAMNLDAILTPRADVLMAVARDASGEPVAFARFAIAGGGRILTLDVAPRRRDAPNGVVERIIVEVVEYARAHGATEVTLNFAGMRRIYAGLTPGAHLLQIPLHALDRWIELHSLYLFTGKFHPLWRPRQLRMRSWWEIVPVAAAALTSEFGGHPPAPLPAELPGDTAPAVGR